MIRVRLYTRPGCHLCDVMKATLQHVVTSSAAPVAVEEIDISRDAELEARYGLEIPVLEIDGKKAAKYTISVEALTQVLAGRAR